MDSQKQQAAERIKQATNILVTVSNNPSVDQLAACIGLTLSLNKLGKHATAVFSGQVPSTLEFLQPEKTIEKNTDSLRDFIIALDKSKADKLRYKVEDKVVKIFITPYRTSINENDLEFSQGDFNVDVVVALGVHAQADLDQAITTHGRILHDAAIITMNVKPGGELGTINWLNAGASSLSELGTELVGALDKKLIDGQVATAFLTGIVSETDRFSNGKTTPLTMSLSAELMAAGANQQLVATKLEESQDAAAPLPIANHTDEPAAPPTNKDTTEPAKKDDGTLEIAHESTDSDTSVSTNTPTSTPAPQEPLDLPEPSESDNVPQSATGRATSPVSSAPLTAPPQINVDEHGHISTPAAAQDDILPPLPPREPRTISRHAEPPAMSPVLPKGSASSGSGASLNDDQHLSTSSAQGVGLPTREGLLPPSMQEDLPVTSQPAFTPPTVSTPQPSNPEAAFPAVNPLSSPAAASKAENTSIKMPNPNETLSDIERDVHSSHLLPPPGSEAPAFADNPSSVASGPALSPMPPALNGNDQLIPNLPVPDNTSGTPASSAESSLDDARNAVAAAFSNGPPSPEPIQALNATPFDTEPLNPPSGQVQNVPAQSPPPAPPPMMPMQTPPTPPL